jgi:hypothetical protein
MNWSSNIARMLGSRLGKTLLLFVGLLSGLFYGVFLPEQTKFSNDGPLGELMAQCHQLPDRFTGCWSDLNNVGFNSGAASPGITFGLQWLLGPVGFSKFYAVVGLLILGLGAWCFFRQLRLTPLACFLGGLAAMLNSTFFSVACWGLVAHDIAAGMVFFALAALADTSARQYWLRVCLAGFAVGMAVVEGADVGAIFSLFVAAFILYQAGLAAGAFGKNAAVGLSRLVLVVACAAFLAAQAISGLINTAIKGIAATHQDVQTKAQRWDWATQWSLPKREALTLVAPGLFGYCSNTPNGENYWGMIGRDPAWDKFFENGGQGSPPKGLLRYCGSGYYAGEIVVLLAFWAAAQSFRRKNSIFVPGQRKWLWFWLGMAVLTLLLALGRFAPFYQWFYALPYVSTIRNPVKFLYPFSLALSVLFAYGVDGLGRKYMPPAGPRVADHWAGLHNWWGRAAKFDKYWTYGCGLAWVGSLLAWWEYANHRQDLEQYLQSVRAGGSIGAMAGFSIHQAGWFPLFFLLAAGVLTLIISGAFAGKRAGTGGILLGLLLVADLGLANQPWIVYWNYPEKYASNPIFDLLRDKPYEHRVALPPLKLPPKLAVLNELYSKEWLQQQFPYYSIQSFDIVDMPRMPDDYSAFQAKMLESTNADSQIRCEIRAWQLTNTRYLLAPANFYVSWNARDYLAQTPLRAVTYFNITPKPGIIRVTAGDELTAVPDADGDFALFEFSGALPRAKLYSRWQVNTNDHAVLGQMFRPDFNPESSVFVAGGLPSDSEPTDARPPAAEVEFVRYAPKDIVLKAEAAVRSVLLLNDHYDANWKVSVDGKPEKLLRCNFLMRGVYLVPGTHLVEFKFQPPVGMLCVGLASLATGLLVVAIFVASNKKRVPIPPPSTQPTPAPSLAPIRPKRKPSAR